MKTLQVRNLDQWRRWLEKHHAAESEIWLIFPKRDTGVASIEYSDALDEALCFGWVDSLVQRLDDEWYARKFTPRRNPAASRYFEALSPSKRRRYLGWIESARREETKRRRLEEAIRLLAAGKEVGLK